MSVTKESTLSEVEPLTEKIKMYITQAYNIGIQMKRKELTKTFIMLSY